MKKDSLPTFIGLDILSPDALLYEGAEALLREESSVSHEENKHSKCFIILTEGSFCESGMLDMKRAGERRIVVKRSDEFT
jgi:hypothetical protein